MLPVLGIVPARGGSKGIPGKNIKALAGRPLLWYAIEAARTSGVIDRLILTTDSEEIAAVGRTLGVEIPFMRPAALADDEAPMLGVLQHAVAHLEQEAWSPAFIVLLQPTSPLRTPAHIRAAVAALRETSCDAAASVIEIPRHFSPDYVMRIEDGRLLPFLPDGKRVTRRQDARPAYARDGTVYAVRRDVLMIGNSLYGSDCRPLLLAPEECLTIDSPRDWEAAEERLSSRR